MKVAQFKCSSGVTILLDEKIAASAASEHVRISEWADVEFVPRQPAPEEKLAALAAEEQYAKELLRRIDEKRRALQEVAP